jgi:hypothetical protein
LGLRVVQATTITRVPLSLYLGPRLGDSATAKELLHKPYTQMKRKQCQASRSDVAERNVRGKKAGAAAVKSAKQKGVAIINNGAGTMPLNAPAPFGGERYTLLVDDAGACPVTQVSPHDGGFRCKEGKLVFADAPDFRPLLSPAQCIKNGVFGGCYFNSRGGKPGIFGRDVAISASEFPAKWFENVETQLYCSRKYNIPTNKYQVKSGQDQKFW